MRWFAGIAGLCALLLAGCSGKDEGSPEPTGTPVEATASAVASAPASTPTTRAGEVTGKKLGTSAGVATTVKEPVFSALSGAKIETGILGQAAFAIEMPASGWNGELVLYAHGFAGFGTEVTVQLLPQALRQYLIANGFAWAASSYSENGYTPGIGADDTLALREYFAKKFGEPKRTYIVGASMGGNVVALALENHASAYDGGLSVCGALGGIEQIDYLVSWVALAEYISGVDFPIGEPGADVGMLFLRDVPAALGAPAKPTQKGLQFASAVKNLTGGPRPFFKEGFIEQYPVNFGLALVDPERKGMANRAATNEGDVYDVDDNAGLSDAAVNAGVERYPADPKARDPQAHPDMVPTTGKISDPLLTLHNTGDLFVPITQEQYYRRAVEAAGKGDLLVQRAIRAGGHCKFSDEELTTALKDLVAWVRDGKKPRGEDLMGNLENAGREFTNPLRAGDPGTEN